MKHKDIVDSLSLEEKASLSSGKNFWESQECKEKNIPSIFFADGPHGVRKQALAADHLGLNESIKATCFPTAVTMSCSWDLSLGEELGKTLGKEALSQKVNVLLGPGLNIKRNPRCGRNFEYFSEDPYLAGKMAAAYVKGIQSNGISACVKHFACNNQEEKRMTIDTIVDERALREIYLTGFEIAVKEGKPYTLMSSYNMVNGIHANENPHLMSILRNEWNYDGVVVTDWGGENDRVKGYNVGNEIEMPGAGGETIKEIIDAVKNGNISQETLNNNVDRFIDLVKKTSKPFEGGKSYSFDVKKHHEIAIKCAEESLVLMKNENNILPLKKDCKVALLGDFASKMRYQGAGSSLVNSTFLETPLDIIEEYDLDFLGYEKAFHRFGKKSKKLLKKAINLAKKADIALVYLGLDEAIEAEGLDRKNINLNENQILLLKCLRKENIKTVAILHAGSVVKMDWADEVDALLNAFLPGQGGARAELNILTGKVNPSGKLTETYPFVYEDSPTANYFPGKELNTIYRDSIFVGYRYFASIGKKVRFPFGYGLSYSDFSYRDLKISEKGVYFKIRNNSDVDGKEICQLYISKKDSKTFRPALELKGFNKTLFKAKEEKEIFIPFDEYTFRYWNLKLNRWSIESGRYLIQIGSSSLDIRLSSEYEIKKDELDDSFFIPRNEIPSYYFGKVDDVKDLEFEKLLGYKVPPSSYPFIKKNRMLVHYNTTVNELKYAKGFSGRLFAFSIMAAIKILRAFGDYKNSNTLIMGVLHQPMRGLSRMTGGSISMDELDGLILMFNGHFFKGVNHFFKAKTDKKKELKARRK